MVWVDDCIISIIIFSAFLSLIHGFLREATSLIIWSCAFFISSHFYSYLSIYFTQIEEKMVRNGIAISLLFIVTLILGELVNYMISALVKRTALSGTDRLMGLFVGGLRGIVIVSAVLFLLDTFTDFPQTQDWKRSCLIPKFSVVIRWFVDYCKSTSSFY
ncbi:CvpA family protein [Candidatus Steffania adelgidicola]|uniref:CvpA family protein n=1 Tax=Candidatus Steffania adelgidicola TaxID=1076626 RepID=UPI001D01DA33|nr:CvpA family protein [Candidatus Steffania adelgidicola]UDG79670.1 Colicin V production protein [Candidatus Steffania adelgidicola]